jgi:molecular chaperone GrpE (heat shock protein)
MGRAKHLHPQHHHEDHPLQNQEPAKLNIQDLTEVLAELRTKILVTLEDFRISTERKLDEIEAKAERLMAKSASGA